MSSTEESDDVYGSILETIRLQESERTVVSSDLPKDSDPEWLANFRKYIRDDLLRFVIPDTKGIFSREKVLDLLTDDEAMSIWVAVFTHQTVEANNYKNLEMYEYIGDRVGGGDFGYHLYINRPNIDQADATIIFNKYMKGETQAQWGRNMRLHEWIQSYSDISTPDIEDNFEAIFGAVVILGNRIIPGFGHVLTANLMSNRVQGLDIDIESYEKDPKTMIKEYFTNMDWPDQHPFSPDHLVQRESGNKTDRLKFILTKSAIRQIAAQNAMSENDLRGAFESVEVPSTGKDMPLFEAAYKKLKQYGFDASKPLTKTLFTPEAMYKAQNEKYPSVMSKSFKIKETQYRCYQMLGLQEQPKERVKVHREILQSVILPDKVSKRDALRLLSAGYMKYGKSKIPRSYRTI